MLDPTFLSSPVPIVKGGTGLADVGPYGSTLRSDGIKTFWADNTTDPFLAAPALFVDPTLGNDLNTGFAAVSIVPASGTGPAVDNTGPLKTWAELRRRIGSQALSAPATTITLLGDLPATDPMIVDFGSVGTVTIVGTNTVTKASSVITAYTPLVEATNTPNALVDGATVWTPYFPAVGGQVVAIVAGTGNGTFAWIVKDNGGGSARVSSFETVTGVGGTQPIAGSTYQVQRQTVVASVSVVPSSGNWVFQQLNFTTVAKLVTGGLVVTFQVCTVALPSQVMQGTNLAFTNCLWPATGGLGFAFANSRVFFTAGAIIGVICQLDFTEAFFSDGTLFQASNLLTVARTFVVGANFAIFDWAGNAVVVNRRSGGFFTTFWGTSAVAAAVPVILDGTSQLDVSGANLRFALGSNPAAAITIGNSPTLAAWPAVAASKTSDATSDATFIHQ